ncbi:MAG: hypothetical protein VW405_14755 [Rhodospirillaceae bacterium]
MGFGGGDVNGGFAPAAAQSTSGVPSGATGQTPGFGGGDVNGGFAPAAAANTGTGVSSGATGIGGGPADFGGPTGNGTTTSGTNVTVNITTPTTPTGNLGGYGPGSAGGGAPNAVTGGTSQSSGPDNSQTPAVTAPPFNPFGNALPQGNKNRRRGRSMLGGLVGVTAPTLLGSV